MAATVSLLGPLPSVPSPPELESAGLALGCLVGSMPVPSTAEPMPAGCEAEGGGEGVEARPNMNSQQPSGPSCWAHSSVISISLRFADSSRGKIYWLGLVSPVS